MRNYGNQCSDLYKLYKIVTRITADLGGFLYSAIYILKSKGISIRRNYNRQCDRLDAIAFMRQDKQQFSKVGWDHARIK